MNITMILVIYFVVSLYLIISGREIIFDSTKEDWHYVFLDIFSFVFFLIISPVVVSAALIENQFYKLKRWWHRH